jgi:hypothetical protein
VKTMLALAVLLPTAAFAGSPFDGTWKTRIDSMKFSGKPDVYDLKDGMFTCKSCAPPYTIKADGTMQKTTENPYRDHSSLKITGPSSADWTVQKSGKTLDVTKFAVSADGKTLTVTDTSYAGAAPVTTTTVETRVAAAPAGSHPVAGSWQTDRVTDQNAAGLIGSFTSTDNGLRMEYNGVVTDAKFDGKEYLAVGDPGHTMVTLRRVGDHQIEETDRREGKVTDVTLWTVAADGKTLSGVDEDKIHGVTVSWVMDHQK